MERKPKQNKAARQLLEDHKAIVALTERIAKVATTDEMVACLTEFATLLTRHFKEEEQGIDGLHASIRKRTPEQQSALLGLKDDHTQILERVHGLLARAQEASRAQAELKELGQQLRERLLAHESKETGVFLDSMWTDLGEGD